MEQVIKRNLLDENMKIIKSSERLSFLLINLVTPQSKETYDYNLNLISSFSFKSKEEFINTLYRKGFTEIDGKFYFFDNDKIGIDPNNDLDKAEYGKYGAYRPCNVDK